MLEPCRKTNVHRMLPAAQAPTPPGGQQPVAAADAPGAHEHAEKRDGRDQRGGDVVPDGVPRGAGPGAEGVQELAGEQHAGDGEQRAQPWGSRAHAPGHRPHAAFVERSAARAAVGRRRRLLAAELGQVLDALAGPPLGVVVLHRVDQLAHEPRREVDAGDDHAGDLVVLHLVVDARERDRELVVGVADVREVRVHARP